MSSIGFNPEFVRKANAKRALAEMRRKMREAEEEAERLVAAAREAADAILEGAHEEARLIMRRAYGQPAISNRPVVEIISEVARRHGFHAGALRGRQVTALAARRARREAIRVVAEERKDLAYSEIARVFGVGQRLVHEAVNPRRSHG